MALGWKVFIRTCVVFLYFVVFAGVYVGLHVYLAGAPSLEDSREYGATDGPDFFPVLVVDRQEGGHETLVLRSLARPEYSGAVGAEERSWYFYRLPGEGRLAHHSDRLSYRVETLPARRQLVEVSIGEANGQRTSIYAYEVEGDTISPRSYKLLASFGNNFSPMPFTLIITGIIIFLTEKFLVRRLLKPSS